MSEPIIVEQKQYELPAEGWHKAKLIEIRDLGIVDTDYGQKRKIRFKYQVAQLGKDGQPLTLIEQPNASLGRRSNLALRIRGLTGQFPQKGFDVASVEGWAGEIEIEHNVSEKDGKTYANIRRVRRPGEAAPAGQSGLQQATTGYRAPWIAPDEETASRVMSDDDVPF
jgi:hypothetical protein